MRRDFAFVTPQTGRAEVLDIMRARDVDQLPIVDERGRLRGLHTVRQLISNTGRPNSAVILAGGRGTRLRPITEKVPKPMIPVAGRPILERLVLHLMSHGIRRIYISVNYLAEKIRDHFGDGSKIGCEILYLHESRALGTGGPVSLLDPMPESPILVLNGDLVTQCDIGRIIDFHDAGGYAVTFGLRPYELHIPFGVADVEEDRLLAIREKPTERMLINAGIYVLSPPAVALVPKDTEFPITDIIDLCRANHMSVGGHVVTDDWIDVGRPDELRKANGHI